MVIVSALWKRIQCENDHKPAKNAKLTAYLALELGVVLGAIREDDEQSSEALDGRRRGHEVDAETPGRAQEVAREVRSLADGLEDELPVGFHDHGEVLDKAEEGVGQGDFVGTAVVVLKMESIFNFG